MNQTSGFLKPLQFLFFALLAAQTMFAVILFSIAKPESMGGNGILVQIVPFISTGLAVAGYFIFNARLKALKSETDFDAKKALYRSASLLKWALFEGGVMLALVVFLVSGDVTIYYLGLFLLVHFAIHFPSKARVLRELEVTEID